MKSINIVFVLLQFSSMFLVGCSGMSYAPDDTTQWQAKYYSNPPGAEIYVDGVSVGTAPLAYNYPSIGISAKEIVARFPSGNEQSIRAGYYTFEIFFDFINAKATIKEYPSAFSIFAETREISFEKRVPLTSEMMQNTLPGLEEMRATMPAGIQVLPATEPKPPGISVGPLIEILKVETGNDKVKVIPDADGQARVLISSGKLRQVLEITVDPDGVVKRRVVRSGKSPESIDGAFDSQGRLHLMLDDEHLVLEGEVWQTSDQTPWQESGLKVRNARFVPGAPDLTWVFQVNGAEFNAPARIEIYGFGGYGAGIVWPWFTHGSRTVLVSELRGGYGPWFVLDPQRKESTFATSLGSDRLANISVLYERSRGGLAAESSYYYVCIDSGALRDDEISIPGMAEIQVGTRRIRAAAEGTARLVEQGRRIVDTHVAVDPESGTALVGNHFLVRRKTWSALSSSTFPAAVVPGGQDSFHALVLGAPRDSWWGKGFPIQYLMFSEGAWSTPVELGIADVKSFWGTVGDAVGIANIANEKAFLVWPMEQGIVGRWIQRIK